MVASLALSTAMAMCCQGGDFRPTVTAGVGTKKGGTHAQTNCHPDSFVLHTEAEGRDWQGFQPGSHIPLLRRLADGLVPWSQVQIPGACKRQM